jgi:glycosyltransferase involved in cell wall biosynthesis
VASNFYVWTLNIGKRSACSYYRIEAPMTQLQSLDLASIYEENGENRPESNIAMMYADVAHFYAVSGEPFLHRFNALRRIEPAVRNGSDIYPPAIIYDVDDNNDFVHPFNTVFASQGVRGYPDAKFLEPGEGLEFEDADGKPMLNAKGEPIGWQDQETFFEGTTFDIARNLHQMKVRHEIIRNAHGVTVTSPTLARYMRDVIGARDVYVFPNTIVPEHFEDIRAVRKDDSVRVLWQGGMSHLIDWYPLRDALRTIAQKYPNVKFVIFGEWFNWIHDAIPDNMVEHHSWVSYDAYKLKRGLLNIDVNLCPLVNNVFNACKSGIKWYEASIWETPEATLAAKTPPYSEIVDGETGLHYTTPAEFVEKLSLLIEDAALRRRVADGARRWVLENRTPKATIPGLADFYAEVRAKQRRELGKPIIKRPTLEQIKKVGIPLR